MKNNIFIFYLAFVTQLSFGQLQTDTVNIKLKDVDVVAERNKLFSEMGRVVTVINQSDIKKLPVKSIDELLEKIPGIDIRNRGVNGTQSDISIRGGSYDQVLVLLNGINITDPQTGHYNLDIPVDLADVTRVEVLQGSSARYFGPNAFSGAINIITDKKTANEIRSQFSLGSFDTYSQYVTGGIGNENIRTNLSFSHTSSDGYRENTDFKIFSFFSQTILKTGKSGKLDFQIAYQQKAYGANGFYSLTYPNQFDFTRTMFSALNRTINKGIFLYNFQAYLRQHHDRFELFRNFENAPLWYKNHNYHLTSVIGAKASVTALTSVGKLTFGIDERNEHIYSNVLGNRLTNAVKVPFEKNIFFSVSDNRLISNAFIDFSRHFDNFYFSAGTAINYTSAYDFNTIGGIDAGYAFSPYFRIFVAANTASRLPTFTDLYYKSAVQIANPDLKPEYSKTLEVGGKYFKKNIMINVTGFYRIGENIIDWIKYPDSVKWISKNLTHVNAVGFDAAVEYDLNQSVIDKVIFSYSFVNLDKTASGFDSKYALDYLKHKLSITTQHKLFSHLNASCKLSWLDRSGTYSLAANEPLQNYKPYFLMDASMIWTSKKYEIFADLNNIFNSVYADFGGLKQPGINFRAGIRLIYN